MYGNLVNKVYNNGNVILDDIYDFCARITKDATELHNSTILENSVVNDARTLNLQEYADENSDTSLLIAYNPRFDSPRTEMDLVSLDSIRSAFIVCRFHFVVRKDVDFYIDKTNAAYTQFVSLLTHNSLADDTNFYQNYEVQLHSGTNIRNVLSENTYEKGSLKTVETVELKDNHNYYGMEFDLRFYIETY